MDVFRFGCTALGIFLIVGCADRPRSVQSVSAKNFVQVGNPQLSASIGEGANKFEVLGSDAFATEVGHKSIVRRNSDTNIRSTSLVFGLPTSLLDKPVLFGSVITQVSDSKSERLGRLKLASLPPFQVKLVLKKGGDSGESGVAVMNCKEDCSRQLDPAKDQIVEIPSVGESAEKGLLYLDLSKLGSKLDLASIRKGDPSLSKLKSKSSDVVRFDFSDNTLVFDVDAHMIPSERVGGVLSDLDLPLDLKETVITNRWYIKLAKGLNPQFVVRKPTPGVGFFTTKKSKEKLIERWDFDLKRADQGIKYYLKHVPEEFQKAFASAFDEWNQKLLPIIGKKVFDYEFINAGDPKDSLVITGDVRFNVLEWDLHNRASYGGLGPSLAHQYTGEIFSANVLVQGPHIVELYRKWFEANDQANLFRRLGKEVEAEEVLLNHTLQMVASSKKSDLMNQSKLQLNITQDLTARIRAQEPELEDPALSKEGFDPVPVGYNYETYMFGYWHDLVAHEVGHNLGLRHNFRGNLGSVSGVPVEGGVSRSIMEYLGRGYRYLDRVGEYDVMAIAYGYKGELPKYLDWFCTDEDHADIEDPTKSAECTKSDATDDPFGFFAGRLDKAVDLLLARGKTYEPKWSLSELNDQISIAATGMGTYAASAVITGSTWTSFFGKFDRPKTAEEVKDYVLRKVKGTLCDPSLKEVIASKETEEGRARARENLANLRARVADLLTPVFSADEVACAPTLEAETLAIR